MCGSVDGKSPIVQPRTDVVPCRPPVSAPSRPKEEATIWCANLPLVCMYARVYSFPFVTRELCTAQTNHRMEKFFSFLRLSFRPVARFAYEAQDNDLCPVWTANTWSCS